MLVMTDMKDVADPDTATAMMSDLYSAWMRPFAVSCSHMPNPKEIYERPEEAS